MDNSKNRGSTDGRIERAKDAALGSHWGAPSVADEVGEAAGGISGAVLGAGVGLTAGPFGALLGGIAGALGGWWAGRAVSEAAEVLGETDDEYYRSHFASHPNRPADRSYEDIKSAYYLGHVASENPNFTAREFDEVEPELQRGWDAAAEKPAPWAQAKAFVREGYSRARERRTNATLANQITPIRPDERRD